MSKKFMEDNKLCIKEGSTRKLKHKNQNTRIHNHSTKTQFTDHSANGLVNSTTMA